MRFRLHTLGLAVCLGFAMAPCAALAGFDEAVAAHDKKDYATALREFKKLATAGDPNAQFNVGLMYANGQGTAQNIKEALKWYHLAANQNDISAQINLGIMYATGQGVELDYKEAAKWYRMAADQGVASAQFHMGVMHATGQGVPQNYEEAINFYQAAIFGFILNSVNFTVNRQ